MEDNAAVIVRSALAGTGIEVVGSCPVAAYNARAPGEFHSDRFLPGARGLVVAASAGPGLWRAFREHVRAGGASWDDPHPYDDFVAELLSRADEALAARGIRACRFEARFDAPAAMAARPACEGCAAPCVGGWGNAGSEMQMATTEARGRCVVGQGWRYEEEQIGYHYERERAVERLKG